MIKKETQFQDKKKAGTISARTTLHLQTRSPEETRRLGRLIGKHASPGDVCLMVGDLGAGKTCLSQGIAWGLGIKGYIMSPSFVLVREYRQGRLPLFHMDLYRLQDINELQDIGIDEYLYSDGICVIEWAEKGMNLLPRGHLLVNIDTDPDDTRIFTIKATDEKHLNLLSHLSR